MPDFGCGRGRCLPGKRLNVFRRKPEFEVFLYPRSGERVGRGASIELPRFQIAEGGAIPRDSGA